MKASLEVHDRIVRDSIEGYRGRVVKTTGDGFMAVFEAEPLDAIGASIAAQAELAHAEWGATGPLRIRIGLHVGKAQVRGDDFFGPTVNRTARIMAAGHGGQVLASSALADLAAGRIESAIELRDLGEHRLKDLTGTERIYQVAADGLEVSFPHLATLDIVPNNLPTQTSPLLGRDSELAELRVLLDRDDVRLITAIGPGGTGKTRLALQAAADQVDRFEDGVYFVDLADTDDVDGVFAAVARTVRADGPSEDPPLEMLKQAIDARPMLLVLDNFEQVVQAGPQLVELLKACRKLNLLVTSREALRTRGEYTYPVSPLALPESGGSGEVTVFQAADSDAVQLFVARAIAVDHAFALDDGNVSAVVGICRRVDGLPLAIELAAARLRLFSPEELFRRLEGNLDLLKGGAQDVPDRQRTLRAMIDWSYDLLTDGERSLLRTFSVFAGGSLVEIEAVADDLDHLDSAEVLDDLESLVSKSLVQLRREGSETRFGMLATIREYAAEALAGDSEEVGSSRFAHATEFVALSQRLRPHLVGAGRDRALVALSADMGNLRIAWKYWVEVRDADRLRELLETLWVLHDAEGHYHGAIDLANDLLGVLAIAPSTTERAREQAALQMSLARAIMAIRGYTAEVEDAFRRAVELSGDAGTLALRFPVLRSLASLYILRGEIHKAVDVGSELLAIADAESDRVHQVDAHMVLGSNMAFIAEIDAGLDHLDRAIELFDPREASTEGLRLGPNSGVVSFTTSAFLLWLLGYPDRAQLRAERALEAADALNHPYSTAYALFHVAFLHLWNLNVEEMNVLADRLLVVAERYDYRIWQALALVLQGVRLVVVGESDDGLARIDRGVGLYETANAPPVFWGLVLGIRAMALAIAQRFAEANALVDEALQLEYESEAMLAQTAIAKADVLLGLGDVEAAVGWYERAFFSADQFGARTPQLIAATRLVRVRGDRPNKRRLEEVYATFTEGFGTAALIEARAVLGVADEA
jgi:predicted ATPase